MLRTFALGGLLALAAASAADAHPSFEQPEAVQGATVKFVLRIPHGCDGQATLKLAITIPQGVVTVKPMPKPGWQLELMSGAYERTYKTSHAEVGDGVRQVVFTGELPDSWFDELVFRAVVTDRFRAGTKVFVPLVQTCAQGQAAWVDVPAAGQDAHRLEYPAPSVTVVSAPLHTH